MSFFSGEYYQGCAVVIIWKKKYLNDFQNNETILCIAYQSIHSFCQTHIFIEKKRGFMGDIVG